MKKKGNPEVAHRIQKVFEFINLPQATLGDRLGIKQQSVSEIKNTGNISKETAKKLEDLFGIPTSWLLYGEGRDPTKPDIMADVYKSIPKGMVPIIKWNQIVRWINREKSAFIDKGWEYVYSPSPDKEQLFALRINSEAMTGENEEFKVGGVIFVNPFSDDSGEVLPMHGDYVIAIKKGAAEAIFRQCLIEGGEYLLRPLHNQFPIEKIGENYTFLGVVIKYQKDIKQ